MGGFAGVFLWAHFGPPCILRLSFFSLSLIKLLITYQKKEVVLHLGTFFLQNTSVCTIFGPRHYVLKHHHKIMWKFNVNWLEQPYDPLNVTLIYDSKKPA